MMAYYPGLEDEDDTSLDGVQAPASSIAGPQTPRDQVMKRIAQVRSGGQPDEQTDQPVGGPDANNRAALMYAQNNALSAGLGRATNALAAGTGFKPDNAGYDALEKQGVNVAEKELSRSAQVQKAVENRKLRSAIADQSQKNFDAKMASVSAQRAQTEEEKQARLDEKAKQAHVQAYNQTGQLLEQMRGSPAVAQAEKDIYSAAKANSIIKTFAPDGNLNNISPTMSKLMRNEIAKIATGGLSTVQELNDLDPHTLSGRLAEVWQKFSNEPSPANAAEFIKQNKQYADSVTKDAQKTITDRYGRIINARKDQFDDSQRQNLEDLYLNRFKDAAGAVGAGPVQHPPGSVVQVKGKNYRVGADGDTLEPM